MTDDPLHPAVAPPDGPRPRDQDPGPAPGSARDLTGIGDREPLSSRRHPVPLERREGVFIHLYRCRVCQLKWAVFSWLADPSELRAGTVACPWCRGATPVVHAREKVSDARSFVNAHIETEIEGVIARLAPGARLMADSQVAPFDAYVGDPADRD